jgi:hypothetical protein
MMMMLLTSSERLLSLMPQHAGRRRRIGGTKTRSLRGLTSHGVGYKSVGRLRSGAVSKGAGRKGAKLWLDGYCVAETEILDLPINRSVGLMTRPAALLELFKVSFRYTTSRIAQRICIGGESDGQTAFFTSGTRSAPPPALYHAYYPRNNNSLKAAYHPSGCTASPGYSSVT